jgi:hypothetical protein
MWDCQQLIGLTVAATDGEVGELTDLCFDDERWVIRYFIVHTSSNERQMVVALGIDQLAQNIANERSARAREGTAAWTPGIDGAPVYPPGSEAAPDGVWSPAATEIAVHAFACPVPSNHLRRVAEVRGYRVRATDGDVGFVHGFLISESSWSIEYVIVETPAERLSSRKVVLVPSWIQTIEKSRCTVGLSVSRDIVLAGPEFTADIQESYEAWLLNHLTSAVKPSCH